MQAVSNSKDELKTFPNHVHIGNDKDAKESESMDLQRVLEEFNLNKLYLRIM